jgi:AGZA family xanthine/uracil permease-like MFS transporter
MNKYAWLGWGDVNAFFGLTLDNIAVLLILVTTISSTVPWGEQGAGNHSFSPDFVMTHMVPGTALGVLVGDLVYTWMAIRLARRIGNSQVTAMPLGLDTPSTFGMAFLVLRPALQQAANPDHPLTGGEAEASMRFAWHVGLLVLVLVAVIKLMLAPFGNQVRRLVPRAGLLGSLAAIALALIAFLPLVNDGIASVPLIGMVVLSIVLFSLVAHQRLPFGIPGAFAAFLVGLIVHGVGVGVGHLTGAKLVPDLGAPSQHGMQLFAFWPFGAENSVWWGQVWAEALGRLPVALPFALATVVGGIDCTESAAAAGDEYDTRHVLWTEGFASLVAGALGGVIQTTPYIGHPAYKKMGGRAGYTLATAIFIGLAGLLGWFVVLESIPRGALYPILVFVGLEITAVSFQVTAARHHPALAFAMLPALAVAALLCIKGVFGPFAPQNPSDESLLTLQTLRCLSNGFLLTSLLWASALAMMIDGRARMASVFLLVASGMAFCGVIHSPLPNEQVGFPWQVLEMVPAEMQKAVACQTPWHWAGAYLLCAGLVLVAGMRRQQEKPAD